MTGTWPTSTVFEIQAKDISVIQESVNHSRGLILLFLILLLIKALQKDNGMKFCKKFYGKKKKTDIGLPAGLSEKS